MRDPAIQQAKSRLGVDSRLKRDTTEARRELAEANIAAYITRVVAAAPPLTAEQGDRLALLLRGSS